MTKTLKDAMDNGEVIVSQKGRIGRRKEKIVPYENTFVGSDSAKTLTAYNIKVLGKRIGLKFEDNYIYVSANGKEIFRIWNGGLLMMHPSEREVLKMTYREMTKQGGIFTRLYDKIQEWQKPLN